MKHKHNWQFIKEFQVDMFNQIAWKMKEGVYSKFACDCGAVKVVVQRSIKDG